MLTVFVPDYRQGRKSILKWGGGGVPLPGQGNFCIWSPKKQFLMHGIWGKDY